MPLQSHGVHTPPARLLLHERWASLRLCRAEGPPSLTGTTWSSVHGSCLPRGPPPHNQHTLSSDFTICVNLAHSAAPGRASWARHRVHRDFPTSAGLIHFTHNLFTFIGANPTPCHSAFPAASANPPPPLGEGGGLGTWREQALDLALWGAKCLANREAHLAADLAELSPGLSPGSMLLRSPFIEPTKPVLHSAA